MIAGYLLVGALPERMADGVFDRLARRRQTRFNAHQDQDVIVERLRALLDGHFSDRDIRACAEQICERRLEDEWGRWQASHKAKWHVKTEVVGLEHFNTATERGSGVVFWGMSFCGRLFPKIALSRAGVELTQLSVADHGTSYPQTLLGKWVVGPLYCLPEGRYLCERIQIPADGSNSYLRRIGEVLKNKGCVWIAGERIRAKKLVSADVLGRPGRFPIGAPLLAYRHNATLLPVHAQRLGRLHYRVTIEPPIPVDRSMRRNEVVNGAIQDYAQRLAVQILSNPADWDWDHAWVESLLTNGPGD